METHLIPSILKVALGQRPHVEIYGSDYDTADGTCIRDYIHVLDISSAHLAALPAPESGFFNLGSGCGFSVAQVIQECREVTRHPIPSVVKPRRLGDPARLVANAAKVQATLGWRPRYSSLRQMVESAWQWHRRRPLGYEQSHG